MLHLLSNDDGAINMVNVARRYSEVHLFVVHGVNEAEIVDGVDEEEVYLCHAPTLVEEVGEMDAKVGEVEVQGAEMEARVYEVQAEGEVGEMNGEGGGMEADVCEEDQVGEMDVEVCEVHVEGEVGEMDG